MKILSFLTIFFCLSLNINAQTYDEWIDISFKCLKNNDLSMSEQALKEAMKLEPANQGNVLLLSNLGTIQRRQGKKDEALVSYTAAMGRAPNNVTFLDNRASLFVEMGRFEDAVTDYTVLLDVEPTNENALYQRGLLYLQLKHFDAAQTDFERIVELNPNTLNGRLGIASLCKLRQEYDQAEKIYYFLLDKVHDNPGIYAGRAELYLLTGKIAKAMNDVQKAFSLHDEEAPDPYLYMLRARIKLLQYEKTAARQDIEAAIKLGYSQAEAQQLLQLCK